MPDVRDLLLAEDLAEGEAAALLLPYGFADPSATDAALQRMCPALTDRLALAEALPQILEQASTSASPEQCLLQLERLAESYGQRSALYHRLGADPRTLSLFFQIASVSRSLADLLVLNPEYLEIISNSDSLSSPRSLDDLRMEASSFSGLFQGTEAVLNALRRMRRREYLRIGVREIAGFGTFEEVVREISDLACALVGETLAVCYEGLSVAEEDKPGHLAVVAFGKLGARELNYSSDIDLALVWDADQDQETAAAFYNKLGQALISALGDLTAEGRMYRVDMRLRPFGASGPITVGLPQFLTYYESWSQPWERQALIKARTIAGPPLLRERIDNFIQDFAFSRRLDSVSISEILALKDRSEAFRARSGDMSRQVKHGWGGIRDVEFTVQLLQLVACYEEPSAREPATLDALRALGDLGLVSRHEEAILADAYVFLRQVEHRLQLAEELPVQQLSNDPAMLRQMGLVMGYRDEADGGAGEEFWQDYTQRTEAVREIHERLFKQFLERQPGKGQDLALIEDEHASPERLREYGFAEPEAAAKRLREIAGVDSGVTSEPQRRFLQQMPDLLEALKRSSAPDQGLARLQSIAEATGSRLSFYRALMSNPRALQVFVRLVSSSEFLAGALARHPEYIDNLSGAALLAQPRKLSELEEELESRVVAERDGSARLDVLRKFRLREFLRIAMQDVAGLAGVTRTTMEISLLAEACLRVAASVVTGRLDGAQRLPGRLAVVGLGKLGGRELHYSSDLDIVCVYEQDADSDNAHRLFERAVRSLLDTLGRLTAEGRGFEVDLRLRPQGSSGALAQPIEGYRKYLSERVSVWERQAMVRARAAAGDRRLGMSLVADMHKAVWGRPVTEDDLEELRHIKRRIESELSKSSDQLLDLKRGRGGILDLEFTVQLLQLAYGATDKRLRVANTYRAISRLGAVGRLNPGEVKVLRDAYLFLRKCENRLQIENENSAEGVPLDREGLSAFARQLARASSADRLLQEIEAHMARVREIHEDVFFQRQLTREAWEAPDERKMVR